MRQKNLVPARVMRPVLNELYARLGKKETARRIGISLQALWRIDRQKSYSMKRPAAERAVYLLAEIKHTPKLREELPLSASEAEAMVGRGMSGRQIMAETGLTINQVRRVLAAYGLRTDPFGARAPDARKLALMCEWGMTRQEIADALGKTKFSVDAQLRKHGLRTDRRLALSQNVM